MGIYLDYNASAPIDLRVLDTMVDVYKNVYGNSDSRTHDYGNGAREVVEKAREQVASLLNVNKGEVFFTSGSTESNNIAILGLKQFANETKKKHIITSGIEHKAILETVKSLEKEGFEIEIVMPDQSGRVDAEVIKSKVREDTLLVTLMHANNETGIIQPVKEIGEYLAKQGVLFHIDATQTCGKLVQELKEVKYDMLSLSAHKLAGPQGIGALVLRKKRYKLPPVKNIIYGGQQEHGIRPGTVPVALVAGLGKACEIAEQEYKEHLEKYLKIKSLVLELFDKSEMNYVINGDPAYCMSNTINVSILGVHSEALMLATKQYCGISNGSACTSNDYNPSYVLTAMGLSQERISSAIRISWGAEMEIDEVHKQVSKLLSIAKSLIF